MGSSSRSPARQAPSQPRSILKSYIPLSSHKVIRTLTTYSQFASERIKATGGSHLSATQLINRIEPPNGKVSKPKSYTDVVSNQSSQAPQNLRIVSNLVEHQDLHRRFDPR